MVGGVDTARLSLGTLPNRACVPGGGGSGTCPRVDQRPAVWPSRSSRWLSPWRHPRSRRRRRAVLRSAAGKTFAYIPHITSHPVWLIAKDGWDANAAELGFTGQWVGSTSGDVTELVTALDAAIVQGVDGIAIAAINPSAMGASIDRAVDAGVPVVTILADAADSKRQAFLGPMSSSSGSWPRRASSTATGGEGEVAVIVASLDIENQRADPRRFTAELAAEAPGLDDRGDRGGQQRPATPPRRWLRSCTAHPARQGHLRHQRQRADRRVPGVQGARASRPSRSR